MPSVSEKIATLEREIAVARSRGDMLAAKRLTSQLQQERTLTLEPAHETDEASNEKLSPRRVTTNQQAMAPTHPVSPQSDADTGPFVVEFPFTRLGRVAQQGPRPERSTQAQTPRPLVSGPTLTRTDATIPRPTEADKPPDLASNPPDHTSSTALPVAIDWPMLQRVLPTELAECAKDLCCGLGTKQYPGEQLELDSVWNLLHLILRFSLDMRYSECLHLGIDAVGELGNQLKDTLSGEAREYPCEQYDRMNEIMRGRDEAVIAPTRCNMEARCKFLRFIFLFRSLVMSDVAATRLISNLQTQAGTEDTAQAVVLFHNSRVPSEYRITQKHLIANRFPQVLRELRNASSHKHPTWLNRKTFPKVHFIKACGELLSEALLEWVSSEPWLVRITRGHIKRRNKHGAWFEIDLMGSPVVFVSSDHLRSATDDDSFVIDHTQGRVLFPYSQIWRTH